MGKYRTEDYAWYPYVKDYDQLHAETKARAKWLASSGDEMAIFLALMNAHNAGKDEGLIIGREYDGNAGLQEMTEREGGYWHGDPQEFRELEKARKLNTLNLKYR